MPLNLAPHLNLTPRLNDPDALFAALVHAHDTLDDPTSRKLDAALILLLANHIGDDATVLEAICTARRSILASPVIANEAR